MPIYSFVLPREQTTEQRGDHVVVSSGELKAESQTLIRPLSSIKASFVPLVSHCRRAASSLILGSRMAARDKGAGTLTRPSHAAVQFANTPPRTPECWLTYMAGAYITISSAPA
jgi:hypothetical protein